MNDDRLVDGVGTLHLTLRPKPLEALNSAIREALKVGTPQKHPAVQALSREQEINPEVGFHIGIMVDALADLDAMMARLKDTNASEPGIKGRLKFTVNRAKPSDHEIDASMETSPTFRDATRHCYGCNGCQVFVETDLLASGPLGENMVIEFDHAFADRPLICLAQRNWAELDWIWAVRGRRHLTAVVIDIDAGHALRSMRCTGRFSRMNEKTSWIELIPPDKLNFVNERLS